MPTIELRVDSEVPPDVVMAAATDFSERRLNYWPNISPKFYQVHNVTETSADVTEGSGGMNFWARELYDWSTRRKIVGTVKESNIFQPGGTWTMTVEPHGDGSHITVLINRQTKGFKGWMASTMMSVIGKGLLTKHLKQTLAAIAADPPSAAQPASVGSQPGSEPAVAPEPPSVVPSESSPPVSTERVETLPQPAEIAPEGQTTPASEPTRPEDETGSVGE